MDKSKRKRKPGQPGWLSSLFAPATIDFIAYLPIEECTARLQSREKTGFWHSTKTYVNLTALDDSSVSFHIERGGTQHRTITANGCLELWEDIYTRVSGEVQSKSYGWLWVLIIVPFLCGYSIFMRDVVAAILIFTLVAGVIAGVILIDLYIMTGRRHNLAAMIEDTLGY